MTYLPRLIVTAFGALAAANLVSAPLTMAALSIRQRAARVGSATSQAAMLLWLRLLPLTAGLVVVLLTVWSFVAFEPNAPEQIGSVILRCLALGGVFLTVASVWRAGRDVVRTRRIVSRWMTTARAVTLPGWTRPGYAIESSFPVVAVVGTFRPRLVIASCVLAACSPDELAAVLRHEHSHVRRRDNASRALFVTAPDLVSWLPVGSRFARAWHAAAEAAADDEAGSDSDTARLVLAEALVRVARLAAGQPGVDLPSSALFRGEDLGPRVRRLVSAPLALTAPGRIGPWLFGAGVLALIAAGLLNTQAVHEIRRVRHQTPAVGEM